MTLCLPHSIRHAACRGLLRKTLAAALLATCGAAQALLLGAGQSVLMDVDLRQLTPAPSYTLAVFALNPDLQLTVDTVFADLTIVLYGGAGGTGSVFTEPYAAFLSNPISLLGAVQGLPLSDPEFTDGVFSVSVSNSVGSFVFNPQALGALEPIRGPVIFTDRIDLTGVVQGDAGTVPEPASLGLAGAAVLAGLLTRRRPGQRIKAGPALN